MMKLNICTREICCNINLLKFIFLTTTLPSIIIQHNEFLSLKLNVCKLHLKYKTEINKLICECKTLIVHILIVYNSTRRNSPAASALLSELEYFNCLRENKFIHRFIYIMEIFYLFCQNNDIN